MYGALLRGVQTPAMHGEGPAAEYLARHDVEIYLADAVAQLLRQRGTVPSKAGAAAFLAQYFR